MPASGADRQISSSLLESIARAIARDGYVVLDGALPAGMLEDLLGHVRSLPDPVFIQAGVGRMADHQSDTAERTDQVCWLENDGRTSGEYLAWMEQLRLGLNQRLYLGLFDYEAHYARYAPGAYYAKHRDAFAEGRCNRVLSTVLYLNPDWDIDDGGEMILFDDDGQTVLEAVQPQHGRLLIFLSERFPHQVNPTRRTRYSIAGWFRVNR